MNTWRYSRTTYWSPVGGGKDHDHPWSSSIQPMDKNFPRQAIVLHKPILKWWWCWWIHTPTCHRFKNRPMREIYGCYIQRKYLKKKNKLLCLLLFGPLLRLVPQLHFENWIAGGPDIDAKKSGEPDYFLFWFVLLMRSFSLWRAF